MLARTPIAATIAALCLSTGAHALNVELVSQERFNHSSASITDGAASTTDEARFDSEDFEWFGPQATTFLLHGGLYGQGSADQHSEFSTLDWIIAGGASARAEVTDDGPETGNVQAMSHSRFDLTFRVDEPVLAQIGGGMSHAGTASSTLTFSDPSGVILFVASADDGSGTGVIEMILEPGVDYRYQIDSSASAVQDGRGIVTANTGTYAVLSFRTAVSVPDADAAISPVVIGPNPARAGSALLVQIGEAGPVELSVHDAAGRRVRSFAAIPRSGAVGWDGRGDDGRALAPGVYFVRVGSADGVRTARLTLLP